MNLFRAIFSCQLYIFLILHKHQVASANLCQRAHSNSLSTCCTASCRRISLTSLWTLSWTCSSLGRMFTSLPTRNRRWLSPHFILSNFVSIRHLGLPLLHRNMISITFVALVRICYVGAERAQFYLSQIATRTTGQRRKEAGWSYFPEAKGQV